MRKLPKWIDILLIPLINLTIALFLSALVVLYIGEDPMDALSIMIKGAIGSSYERKIPSFLAWLKLCAAPSSYA